MVSSLSRNGNRRQSHPVVNLQPTPLGLSLPPLPKTPLFGTDGIRGRAGELLNAGFALELGFWAGQTLSQLSSTTGPVIIGQDSRNSSDMLSTAIAAGLTSAGIETWQVGLCPTPCVAHLAKETGAIGGIMISASHNPPEDNGIKFFSHEGKKLAKTATQQIEAGLRGHLPADTVSGWGQTKQRQGLVSHYGEFLQNTLPEGVDLAGMRIVLDLAWGASTNLASVVFRSLGAEVICLHDQPDGDQINVNCGSTHLSLLRTAVLETQADLGIAFDGDADRALAVDAQGRTIDGDYILYFWGQKLKQEGLLPGNLLIGTVMANLGFERAWESLGGKFYRTAVGDQNVQAQMWETGAMLGGEQSGHIICHHHSFSGDGLQTALHLAALVKQAGVSLAELVDQSFQTYPQILQNVRVEDRDRRCQWQECDPLQQAISRAELAMGKDGRVLVRASGTEPVIRVMVESCCPDAAAYWTTDLVRQVEQHLVC